MSREAFEHRVLTELLPAFCDDPSRAWGPDGFRKDFHKVSDADAEDFIRGMDQGLIEHVGRGLYRAPRSHASEQFFWSGSKTSSPRTITLWAEPVITIAALGRLHLDFGWPKALLGAQSVDYAFDVIAFLPGDFEREYIAAEIKKSTRELGDLIELMIGYGAEPAIETAPQGKELNALRKVQGLRSRRAPVFWAVGPDRTSRVFRVSYGDDGVLMFGDAPERELSYDVAVNVASQIGQAEKP